MSRSRLIASVAILASLAAAVDGCGTASPGVEGDWSTTGIGRPSPSVSWPTQAASTGSPSAPDASPSQTKARPPKPGPPKYVFPVSGKPISYARTHHDYPATDIIAACGLPVRAATDGVILEVSRVDEYAKATDDGALRGGLSVSLLGDDGVRYYGSHLSRISAGIKAGTRVSAGQQIGNVGKTGNANNTCHLHFGISPACARTGDWWNRRGVVWPYTFLDAWRAGKNLSPVSKVAQWKADHGCPAKPS